MRCSVRDVPGATGELTEGERWAREQLAALLARRFSPPAIGAFLLDSQRRTNSERAARPETSARMRRWMLLGSAAYVGHSLVARPGAAALRERFVQREEPRTLRVASPPRLPTPPHLTVALAWWGATWVMLDWHIGMLETEDGRARNLGPADAVTLARAWLVPFVAQRPDPALVFAAWASDGLDGRLARATEPTRLGRDLEGLVDACFAAAALRGARRTDTLPAWALAGELARLGGGFAYALWLYFGRADAPNPVVTKAARRTTPLRVAGLAAAGTGRRELGGALLGAGSLWSLGAVLVALRLGR